MKWQEFFTDKGLQSVIALALANNRDLRTAALNVQKVQAQYRTQRAAVPHGQRLSYGRSLPASEHECIRV